MLSNASHVIRKLRVSLVVLIITCFQKNTEAAYFDGCDHTFNIKLGYSYLESPNYPSRYPSSTSCRYKFVAPLDHDITINCTINLDKAANGCSTEYFYIARDGDEYLRDSEQFCGSGTFIRKSLFRSVVLAYTSGGGSGKFQCQLRVQKQPCDCGWSTNTKIVKGQETSINEFPSMVALKDRTSNQPLYCGAAIISHRHLLTAAHCAQIQTNPAYIEAWVGRHNLASSTDTRYSAVYYISQIIQHPNYQSYPVNNDIAILVTKTDIEYSRGVGPICLPPLSNANNDFAYDNVDVIGWGTTKFGGPTSSVLLKVSLLVMDYETCVQKFQNQNTIYRTQICTYDYTNSGKDACQFDSGGPVIFKQNRQFLLGIISFGDGCGIGKVVAGVNTRVTSYLPWIQRNTAYSTCNVNM